MCTSLQSVNRPPDRIHDGADILIQLLIPEANDAEPARGDPIGSTPPAGSGYYLRVRDKNETAKQPIRWNTPGFSLSPTTPESDVLIVLPEAL